MAAAKIDIEESYRLYHEKLSIALLNKHADASVIEDVVQDAFIKMHLYLNKGKVIDNPQAWLYRVGYNLLMDHYRSKSPLIESNEDLDQKVESASEGHGPEDCLHGIIANLPYKYKKAVYLTDIKGVKQVTAAKQLKISLPTFKSHVQRGRKLVAQGYVDCCDYEIGTDGKLIGESKDWNECKMCSTVM